MLSQFWEVGYVPRLKYMGWTICWEGWIAKEKEWKWSYFSTPNDLSIIYPFLKGVSKCATKPGIGKSKCRRGWCVWSILAKETLIFPGLVTESVEKKHNVWDKHFNTSLWAWQALPRKGNKKFVNLFEIRRMCPSVVKRELLACKFNIWSSSKTFIHIFPHSFTCTTLTPWQSLIGRSFPVCPPNSCPGNKDYSLGFWDPRKNKLDGTHLDIVH